MKKTLLLLTLTLFLTGFTACQKKTTPTDNTNNQPTPPVALEVKNADYASLTNGPIDENYKFAGEEYDIYNNSNPLYYNKTANAYYCRNNEKAEVKQIFPAPGTTTAGPSRMSYYCPQENLYWIRDFPGSAKATVYGPFSGKPE